MTTINKIGVAMFSVADQDAAVAFYTQKLGWEVRSDVSFGEGEQAGRWVEVAPPGSDARLALNPPMGGEPGGGAIGVETPDVDAELERMRSTDGVQVGDTMEGDGTVPRMFSVSDPDGNWIWVVQA
ncbi:VOC family protein [Nocardioides sp.]|uniref:VOC family protein n=1 Tax=Nocardioides sp. TaxID=35761 RepID=UPI002CCB9AAC|nr:VOC family protein [Nocardioides sp.]HSX66899.1 VOC family protein [Nocardioides sp.]